SLMLPSDVVAGLSLLLFGLVGVCLFGLVTYSMVQMVGDIVGFRFLISQAITDILLLIQVQYNSHFQKLATFFPGKIQLSR
ncbi:hypothetical protein ANCDUO_22852, partial [Ancylostoma duodenale]